jgi:hypothetical protein
MAAVCLAGYNVEASVSQWNIVHKIVCCYNECKS